MTFCMNVSRFMNLATIFSLDLESQYIDRLNLELTNVDLCTLMCRHGWAEYEGSLVLFVPWRPRLQVSLLRRTTCTTGTMCNNLNPRYYVYTALSTQAILCLHSNHYSMYYTLQSTQISQVVPWPRLGWLFLVVVERRIVVRVGFVGW